MISGNDLISLGWHTGPELGAALARAKELVEAGMPDKDALVTIGLPPVKPSLLKMRPQGQAAPIRQGCRAESQEDLANLSECVRLMDDVAQLPVVVETALMPDACPAGPGVCVGGVVETVDAVIPAMHSADMFCSMYVTIFAPPALMGVEEMMNQLLCNTHFGVGGRPPGEQISDLNLLGEEDWKFYERNRFLRGLRPTAIEYMKTCGDGNHFAYLGKMKITPGMSEMLRKAGHWGESCFFKDYPDRQAMVLVTHFGSRKLGADVYRRGVAVAEAETARIAKDIPKWGHWIPASSPAFEEYFQAVDYVQAWTQASHRRLHADFLASIGLSPKAPERSFFNAHNFVTRMRGRMGTLQAPDPHRFYVMHLKGATPAWFIDHDAPALGAIPLNMTSPILLVYGNDNREFLSCAPHGAGRNLSRTALLKKLAFEEKERLLRCGLQHVDENTLLSDPDLSTYWQGDLIAENTKGVDVRWFSGKPDLTETPLGYKNPDQVRRQIEEFKLATVWGEVEPLGCIMAGQQDLPWKRRKSQ